MVYKKLQGRYWTQADGRLVTCSISTKLRKRLIYPLADPSSRRPRVDKVADIAVVDPIAIGDSVRFRKAGDGTGVIVEVLPRRNQLSRPAPSGGLEQVIVANVDQIVAVFAAAQPAPKWNLLDRYLVSAESAGIPALICVTKTDLADVDRFREDLGVYASVGYRVVSTSAVTGQGVDAIRAVLAGKVSVLVGKSGVGKTTLLNAIQPGLGLRVGEVSEATDKGRHTTSHLEMFELGVLGGAVVDTPGMRELGLWNVRSDELAALFPEMRPFVDQCRFGADCSHTHEPDCAIKSAVERGAISERRYASYKSLRKETSV